MRFAILLTLVVAVYCDVNENARTKAGQQDSTVQKTSTGGKVQASQSGTSKTGSFTGETTGKNAVSSSSGHKASAVSKMDIKAGTNSNPNANTVKKVSEGYDIKGKSGNTADLDFQSGVKDSANVRAGSNKGFDNKITKSGNTINANAKSQKGNDFKVDIENKDDATVYDKNGNEFATVTDIKSENNIKIKKGTFSGTAGTQKNSRTGLTDNTFVNDKNRFNKKAASLDEKGTKTNIQSGLLKTETNLDTRNKKVTMGGGLIITAKATGQYDDAKEEDCPYNSYADRRRPSEVNKKWKYAEPEFKVYFKEIKVTGEVDKSSGTIKAEWPQCLTVKVPVTFPTGTKLEKLALGLAIYFPGCPRFVCAGRTCGAEFAAKAGLAVGEACFTTDICKLQPVAAGSRKDDFIGYAAGNAETNICDQGYNGGSKLIVTNTFCQHEEDRSKSYKGCPLLNFDVDETAADKKVTVIARLYEKKSGTGGPVGLFCNIKNYYLEGCREMSTDYKLTAFGLNADSSDVTGIKRGGASSSSSGGSSSGSGSSGGQATDPPTTTTKSSPWGSWWNRGGSGNTGGGFWNRGG